MALFAWRQTRIAQTGRRAAEESRLQAEVSKLKPTARSIRPKPAASRCLRQMLARRRPNRTPRASDCGRRQRRRRPPANSIATDSFASRRRGGDCRRHEAVGLDEADRRSEQGARGRGHCAGAGGSDQEPERIRREGRRESADHRRCAAQGGSGKSGTGQRAGALANATGSCHAPARREHAGRRRRRLQGDIQEGHQRQEPEEMGGGGRILSDRPSTEGHRHRRAHQHLRLRQQRTVPCRSHLGLALKNLGKCDEALRAFEASERDGAIQKTGNLYKSLVQNRTECEQRVR